MFPKTAWTQIEAAGGDGDSARNALNSLCETYYPAVRDFISHRVPNDSNAENLTHEFFKRVLETKTVFAKAERGGGNFRGFLSQRLKWFLGERLKPDKHSRTVPLDETLVSSEMLGEKEDREFSRAWAIHSITLSVKHLEQRYQSAQNSRRIQVLRLFRDGKGATQIATVLNISIDTAKNEVRAVKRDSRECLHEIVRGTVSNDLLATEEMEALREFVEAKEN